jgi:branched-chain amino acid transport system permease protein
MRRGLTVRRLVVRPLVLDGVIVVLALLAPIAAGGYVLRVVGLGCLYGTLAMGVVVSYGYGGLPNMSQGALYGVGAYLCANLLTHAGLPFLPAIVITALGTAVAGGLLGAVSLRVKGSYWWLVTIAFAQVMTIVFNSWTAVTGGVAGFLGIPIASVGAWEIKSEVSAYYLGIGIAIVAYVVYSRWTRSRVGLAATAVRADETAARGLGISPGAVKITGMALAGFGAGLAGSGLDAVAGFIDAPTFSVEFSVAVLIFAVVGGLRSLRGSLAAAILMTYLTTQVAGLAQYQSFIYGGVVLAALFLRLYAPQMRLAVGRGALR